MKVYVMTEISSGEVRLSLDTTKVFNTRENAIMALKMSYDQLLENISDYGEITQNEYDITYYSVILFEEDDGDTIYEGYIREIEVE